MLRPRSRKYVRYSRSLRPCLAARAACHPPRPLPGQASASLRRLGGRAYRDHRASIPAPASSGRLVAMPNIKQQKKRVRTAARERLENLRYRSTVKTLTRRLREAVDEGDGDQVAERHTTLVRWIDRAAARGALHKNTAARKKSQAAKLAS